MRAHNAEHRDSLPVLDVSALRHVAYVFDALVYYMRSLSEPISTRGEPPHKEPADPAWNDQVNKEILIYFSTKICTFSLKFVN